MTSSKKTIRLKNNRLLLDYWRQNTMHAATKAIQHNNRPWESAWRLERKPIFEKRIKKEPEKY